MTASAAGSFTATYTSTGSSTTVAPVADAEIRSNKATKNGNLLMLSVRNGTLRSYLRFNIPALGGAVTGARLRLFVVEASTAGGSVFTVGNNWTETGITWNNAPPISGNALGTAGSAAVGTLGRVRCHVRNRERYASELRTERREHECGGLLACNGARRHRSW